MGAAIPRMPVLLGTFALQNTAFEIANDLRLARQRAVATNGKGRIVFGSDSYRLRRETSPDNYVDDGAVRTLPSNTSVTSSPVDPTFDSRGLVTAPYTITVANGYSTKTITVTVIGRVVVD